MIRPHTPRFRAGPAIALPVTALAGLGLLMSLMMSLTGCRGIPLRDGYYCCDPGVGGSCPSGMNCQWSPEAGEYRCFLGPPGDGYVPVCGNGEIDPGEECDGANLGGETCESLGFPMGTLACRANCTLDTNQCAPIPVCGNGEVETGEDCDDGGESATCDSDCTPAVCGDGTHNVSAGEQCDGGGESVACDADCTPAECGDGTVNNTAGEDCDDQGQSADCDPDCTWAICGDSYVNSTAGEVCDAGGANTVNCDSDCTPPECGDGIHNAPAGEGCDDGNTSPCDGCSATCRIEACGNGVQECSEVCDDGNTQDGDGCSANCLSNETCGNNYVDTAVGEQCDDGGTTACDGCSATCRTEACGNGTQECSEVCDDGNTQDGDGCSADCMSDETCGNGYVDTAVGEGCDEGGNNSNAPNASCRTDCQPRRCGDGITDDSYGEVCDDNNTQSGDGCSADCLSNETCGNNYVDTAVGEQCDEGGSNSNAPNASCRTDCQPRRCGDTILDDLSGEVCDDGNTASGDGCSADCLSDETCGNWIVDWAVGETCDDGNNQDGDGCSADCLSDEKEWGTPELIEFNNTGNATGNAENPDVAIDPQGNAMVAWYQSNGTYFSVFANRYEPGVGWGTPQLIEFNDTGNSVYPDVAMDPQGNAIAVWPGYGVRTDIWANRYVAGVGWGTPELIEQNNTKKSSAPEVATDSQGNAVVVWYQSGAPYYDIWANRYVAGVGWETAQLIESYNTGPGMFHEVAVDPQGNAIAVWEQGLSGVDNIATNRYVAGVGWETAQILASEQQGAGDPHVAADPQGNFMAVWHEHDGTSYSIFANRYVAGVGWETAQLIESDPLSAYYPKVGMDSQGNAIAVWRQNDGMFQSIAANRYVAGVGWGTAELIEFDNAGDAHSPKVATDAQGNALAVWYQYDGTRYNIWANRYVAGVGWGTAELIDSEPGDAFVPRVAMNPQGRAVAVWIQTDGTHRNIWACRFE